MKKGNKNNKKGFTLVELLATLVILGLLTLIAAPNIIGMLQNSKLNTYVDDAEKLGTLAEYKFRGDGNMEKPSNGNCVVMSMQYLGKSEFKNPPYGGEYDPTKSFVVVKNESGTFKYYVQLVEKVPPKKNDDTEKYYGFNLIEMSQLSNKSSNPKEKIVFDMSAGEGGRAISITSGTTANDILQPAPSTNKLCGSITRAYDV